MKSLPLAAISIVIICGAAAIGRAEEPAPTIAPQAARLLDPTILLVRDDAVRKELGLSSDKRSALDAMLAGHNRVLLAIRDVGPTGADATAIDEVREVRAELRKLLTTKQRMRLQGLILQAQGYDALSRDDVAKHLQLTTEQQAQLAEIATDFRAKSQELQVAGAGDSAEARQAALVKLQSDRQQRVLEVLDDKQTQRWAVALGEPFDFSQLRPSPAAAPEFADESFASADAWINSPPQTMKSLRGRVVVVHFFAFGCSNCINNYPWYREWHEAFADKPVTIIGIHTPETEAEHDRAQLEASINKRDLKFPVVIDNGKHLWTAWYNNMWPSVYLVDRRGNVRYWWYGELDWQGAGGQKVARQRIEELLAEDVLSTAKKAGGAIAASASADP